MRTLLLCLTITSCVACQPARIQLSQGGDPNAVFAPTDLDARIETLEAAIDAQARLLQALINQETQFRTEVLDLLNAEATDAALIKAQLEQYNHNIAQVYETLVDLQDQIKALKRYKKH